MRLPDGTIYLDANATTPVSPDVASALEWASRERFGNPSSGHRPGREALALLEEGRAALAGLVGCEPGEIIFTASGTEANHLAFASALGPVGKRRALLSSIEHPSVLAQKELWEERGLAVEEIPVDGMGRLDLAALASLLGRGDVALVSVMAAHNETGVVQPLVEAGGLARASGALFHTDAVQAMGKIPCPWDSARPDYLSLSGHKFYGPKGIGALAVRCGAPLRPMLLGGGQEGGARASTQAVPLAHALGIAAEAAGRGLAESARIGALRDSMESVLERELRATVHGKGASRLPNTSLFSLPDADGAEVAAALDAKGCFVATGSACHSGRGGLPVVLERMGLPAGTRGPVRASLCRATGRDEVDGFLGLLRGFLKNPGP